MGTLVPVGADTGFLDWFHGLKNSPGPSWSMVTEPTDSGATHFTAFSL
jgi:hypothetical protein